MVQAFDNISHNVPRALVQEIAENGAGTYNADFFVPAGSFILDVFVHNEVLWAAATSAALVAGDYASSNSEGSPVIGAAIDADGFIASTSVKATDIAAGESISIGGGTDTAGGKAGAYAILGTNTHIGERYSLVDRFVRFTVTSVGAGTAGRTVVGVVFVAPNARETVTQ